MSFFREHKIVSSIFLCLIAIALGLAGFVRYRMYGPYRDYAIDFVQSAKETGEAPGMLEVGVAMRDITPDLERYDTWTDADKNGEFEPEKGDTYTDRNGNGDFDFVWIAGFGSNRPAQGVNDRLWVRAIAFRNNGVTVAMITGDLVGLSLNDVIKLRKSVELEAVGVDHVVFSSTHSHESPDTLGIWSYKFPLDSRYDQGHVDYILRSAMEATEEAVSKLAPVDTRLAVTEIEPAGYVHDSREPQVFDRVMNLAHFTKPGTDETVATLVSWGNHPEAMGSRNTQLSGDFPHYIRDTVENGLQGPGAVEGLGGMCLFFQGSVGGLMTPLHMTIPSRHGVEFKDECIEKAQALGENVGTRALNALRAPEAWTMQDQQVAVAAKTIFVPIDGIFKYAIMLGLLRPGYFNGKSRSEVNAIRVGEMEFLTVPGEIFPEIVDGGIESPEGGDFPGAPLEIPPLRSAMKGKVNFVVNLANDEMGYIVPQTQWDQEAPFTYGENEAPYGEEYIGHPGASVVLHHESIDLLQRLHEAVGEKP